MNTLLSSFLYTVACFVVLSLFVILPALGALFFADMGIVLGIIAAMFCAVWAGSYAVS